MTTVNIEAMVRAAHESKDYDPLIDAIPYARLLGIRCLRLGDDAIFHLPANPDNIGNPTLPALHGGVIAGFMEHSALLHLLMFMGIPHMPKIIDFSIDYLRAGTSAIPTRSARSGARAGAWRTSPLPPGRPLAPNPSPPLARTSRSMAPEWIRC